MKSIKFVFLKAAIVSFFTFGGSLSFSQTQSENHVKTNALNKVQFIGVDEDFLIFDLRFSELPAKGCTLSIIDDGGTIIFEEMVSGSYFTKRYKVVREGMKKLTFKAIGRGFSFNQSFTIRTEEKIIVTTE